MEIAKDIWCLDLTNYHWKIIAEDNEGSKLEFKKYSHS